MFCGCFVLSLPVQDTTQDTSTRWYQVPLLSAHSISFYKILKAQSSISHVTCSMSHVPSKSSKSWNQASPIPFHSMICFATCSGMGMISMNHEYPRDAPKWLSFIHSSDYVYFVVCILAINVNSSSFCFCIRYLFGGSYVYQHVPVPVPVPVPVRLVGHLCVWNITSTFPNSFQILGSEDSENVL